jgi:hypothetical protein
MGVSREELDIPRRGRRSIQEFVNGFNGCDDLIVAVAPGVVVRPGNRSSVGVVNLPLEFIWVLIASVKIVGSPNPT